MAKKPPIKKSINKVKPVKVKTEESVEIKKEKITVTDHAVHAVNSGKISFAEALKLSKRF
jgi:hypothetical protein